MYSLLYSSTATGQLGRDDLRALLDLARERNGAAGITGMLLFHEGQFMQVLEGPREQVDDTYSRISRDRRHRSLWVEMQGEVERRGFPDWTMGYSDLSEETQEQREGFTRFFADVHAGKPVDVPTPAHVLLRAFSRPPTFRRPFR
ncbi:BLUF domain-containing protein [Nocardioides acrostichi]|uniref:BLUF domain-containing protein n=1 Tax=Nocardioides acrostichi TaxID=2784339 RepID=A0A930Y6I0_9ACTN|nr:BLUF domain-containing protein [Nocardioides acrostichi]MBF4162380.1 BLUF domain-containing protein [Nocardioides acrostichi]